MSDANATECDWISAPAIEYRQGRDRTLYSFVIDGKLLPAFASISRIRRDDDGELYGYQRPEVVSHIAEIRTYLESDNPILPNALVVAFDNRLTFEPDQSEEAPISSGVRSGLLRIPVSTSESNSEKPGWIVDGQQRLSAIRDAKVASFPVCVVGFVANEISEQREQFILVNSTKPLPKGLIYELLPATTGVLPSALRRRRLSSRLLARLNRDDGSPLLGLVKTPTSPGGVIKDNSILKMIENSLSDGALYALTGEADGIDRQNQMLFLLKEYWAAVADVFPDAWNLPPRRSRLMHGCGIVSMGFVMDAIVDRRRRSSPPDRTAFIEDLQPLREACRWTSGYWDFGPGVQRRWDEIQNTTRDIQLVSNLLLVEFKARVWNRAPPVSATP